MPAPSRQKRWITSNFRFNVNDLPVGKFDSLLSPSNPAREVLAHELVHVMQQQRAAGASRTFQLVLMRGSAGRSALATWKAAASGAELELRYAGPETGPQMSWKLQNARVTSYSVSGGSADSGSDIAIEKIVIMHEGVKP